MVISGRTAASSKRETKAAVWRRRVGNWQRSGLGQAAFCRRYGLAVSTFQWWRKRLDELAGASCRREAKKTAAGVPGGAFIPVQVTPGDEADSLPLARGAWACEVAGPRGVKVRWRERPSLARLRKLVAVLAGDGR